MVSRLKQIHWANILTDRLRKSATFAYARLWPIPFMKNTKIGRYFKNSFIDKQCSEISRKLFNWWAEPGPPTRKPGRIPCVSVAYVEPVKLTLSAFSYSLVVCRN